MPLCGGVEQTWKKMGQRLRRGLRYRWPLSSLEDPGGWTDDDRTEKHVGLWLVPEPIPAGGGSELREKLGSSKSSAVHGSSVLRNICSEPSHCGLSGRKLFLGGIGDVGRTAHTPLSCSGFGKI